MYQPGYWSQQAKTAEQLNLAALAAYLRTGSSHYLRYFPCRVCGRLTQLSGSKQTRCYQCQLHYREQYKRAYMTAYMRDYRQRCQNLSGSAYTYSGSL